MTKTQVAIAQFCHIFFAKLRGGVLATEYGWSRGALTVSSLLCVVDSKGWGQVCPAALDGSTYTDTAQRCSHAVLGERTRRKVARKTGQ